MAGARSPSTERAIVGRAHELAELRAGLDDAMGGRGRMFLVSGEPGVGKTRLAEEISAEASLRGARVLWGRCWEGGGAPAYWPITQILRGCAERTDFAQAVETLGSGIAHISSLVPEIVSRVRPHQEAIGSKRVDPQQSRFRLFDSVAALLKSLASRQPMVIVIDDLHDADAAALQMLHFLARALKDAPILLIGTHREAEVERSPQLRAAIAELTRESEQLPLSGLSPADTAELVHSRGGVAPGGPFLAALHDTTGGNPLFLNGVVQVLAAQGKLEHQELLTAADLKLPLSVRGAIRSRLDQLSQRTNAMLSVAAAFGIEFEIAPLERVAGMSAAETSHAIDEAVALGFIARVAQSETSYRFTHSLVRAAVYEAIGTAERARLHRTIGEALEVIYAADLSDHLAEIANHFRLGISAGTADKAIDYSIRAAEAAYALFAYDSAISDFETALELIERRDPHSPLKAQILFRLGSVTCFFRDKLRGVTQLESALELYNQAKDERRVAEIHSLLGLALGPSSHHMNVSRALSHFERAEPVLALTADTESLGLHYWGLAMTYFEALQTDKALAASGRAIEIFERLGDERSSSVTGHRCQNLMVKGKQAEARELLEKIRLNASQLKDPEVFKNVLSCCAWYFLLMRDPREAIRIYRLGLTRKDLTLYQRAQLLEFLALAELIAGNLKAATAIASETKLNRTFRGQIAFYAGDWNSATELLQEELDWARNADSRWHEVNVLAHLMDTLRVAGDLDGAMSCLARARSMFGPDNPYWEIRLRPQAVSLLVDAARPDAALEHLQCCRAILAQGEDWLGHAGRVWRAEAMVAAATGDFAEADKHFEEAAQLCKQYCLPWEEAETLHYWGKALAAACDPRAGEKFDAAIDIYRRRGPGQRWIDRVEGDRPSESSAPRANKDSRAIFRREGEYWTLEYQGASSRLRDSKGLQIVATLIGKSGCELRASDLAGPMPASQALRDSQAGNVAGNLGDAGAVLDDRAKSQYRMRLKELRAELEEAEGNNDLGRAESVRTELEAIENQLASALGLGGRDRKSHAHSERARWMVTNSIKRAIAKIDQVNAPLGRHLHSCVRTGNFCIYTPDPDHPVTWQL